MPINVTETKNFNEFSLTGISKRSLFDAGFNVPFDTEKTWDLMVDNVLQPQSRNASASAGGTTVGPVETVGPASTLSGRLPISTDTSIGPPFFTKWVLKSRKNIKFRNSDETLVFICGVFADFDNSVTNTFSIKTNGLLGGFIPAQAEQADWNIDTFGAGSKNPSGITLDFTKIQTLSFHSIKKSMSVFKVGFLIGDAIFYAHEFIFSNSEDRLPFLNIDLPIRCDLKHESAATSQINYGIGDFNHSISLSVLAQTPITPIVNYSLYGASAYSLGESNEKSYPFSAGTKQNIVNLVGPSRVPILSIRPLELYFSNPNTIISKIKNIVFHSRNVDLDNGYILEVIYNGVLVGDSFSDVDSLRSGMSFDLSATSVTGGNIEYTDSIYPNSSKTVVFTEKDIDNFVNDLVFTSIIFTNGGASTDTVTFSNTLTFAATPIGPNANVGIDVNWDEFV